MSVHEITSNREIRVIKEADRPKPAPLDQYVESHELSLLSLLIRKHQEKAREFVAKLSKEAA